MGGDDYDDFAYSNDPEPFMPDDAQGPVESQARYLPASGAQEGVFSFFDTSIMRNWAGPEHWRSRPLACNISVVLINSVADKQVKTKEKSPQRGGKD
jgi:hypothetical protein